MSVLVCFSVDWLLQNDFRQSCVRVCPCTVGILEGVPSIDQTLVHLCLFGCA